MKILMLTWEYPPRIVGGISRVVHDLSHRMIKDGHDVTVVTYRDGNTPYFEDDKGVKVHRVDNYACRRTSRPSARQARRRKTRTSGRSP